MRHAAIILTVFAGALLAGGRADAQIAWEAKLRDAHTKAKQEGKLMLLHFFSDNCVWCDRLEAGAFRSDAVVSTINENFVPVKIHGPKNPKLAKMFKVDKYPTDVVVTIEGKALSHSVSPQQPDRYIAMLSGARGSYMRGEAMLAKNQQATPEPDVEQVAATSTAPSNTAPSNTNAPSPQNSGTGQLTMPAPAANANRSTAARADTKTAAQTVSSRSRQNQFVLPKAKSAEVSSPQAGTETPSASANQTAESAAVPQSTPTASSTPSPNPNKREVAIEGFCPVSVVDRGKWVEGKTEWSVLHLGKLYRFADKQAMDAFLADPIPYTPMLNGIDVVRFFEEKEIVPGKREWGVIDPIHNRMFFFHDEAAMLHFENSFERYLDASIEVMKKAVKEANPGV
jgi:protein disulfide-isomerase